MSTIVANTDNNIEFRDFKFRFKKDKLGNQRAPVELKIGVPSVAGIIAILEKGGKDLELLQEVVADTVRSAVASTVAEQEQISQETFPHDKHTWTAIANQPRAERQTISQDTWNAFGADYIAVMPAVSNKTAEQVGNAVAVYLKKFAQVKTNKDIIGKLKIQLGLYMEHSPNAEQYSDVLDMLLNRADALLKADDTQLLIENL